MLDALKRHWPEYLFEAIGLALFMIFAGSLTTLLEHPDSPVHQALPSKMLRHVLLGLVMGNYIALLIYSPWDRRTGAHINPAVTIAFWRMGKIGRADAIFYILAQFAGALITARLLLFAVGGAFAHHDVMAGATLPGPAGVLGAFAAEFVISFSLLFAILVAITGFTSSRRRWRCGSRWNCISASRSWIVRQVRDRTPFHTIAKAGHLLPLEARSSSPISSSVRSRTRSGGMIPPFLE